MTNQEVSQEVIKYIEMNPDKKIFVCRLSTYKEITDVSMTDDKIVLHY